MKLLSKIGFCAVSSLCLVFMYSFCLASLSLLIVEFFWLSLTVIVRFGFADPKISNSGV
jgi:hypothetical protein